MNSKLALVFILMSVSAASINSFIFKFKNSQMIRCDHYFKNEIQIDKKIIDHLGDFSLKIFYNQRNLNFSACMNFYKKLFKKLDEIFALIK
jgi:hypothetical protein